MLDGAALDGDALAGAVLAFALAEGEGDVLGVAVPQATSIATIRVSTGMVAMRRAGLRFQFTLFLLVFLLWNVDKPDPQSTRASTLCWDT